jgi:PilZ domain
VGGLTEWLRNFRDLHERARKGGLGPDEETTYHAMREELARTMLAAQKISLKPGQVPRRMLRVARALQLDLDVGGVHARSMTLDLSTGGFSTNLARSPSLGDMVEVSLRLPSTEPLVCRARITDVKPQLGSTRVAAQFVNLPDADQERLELFILDTVIALLSS